MFVLYVGMQVNRQMEDVIQSLKRSSEDDSDEEGDGAEKKEEEAEEERGDHLSIAEDCNGYVKSQDQAISVVIESSNGGPKMKLDAIKEEQFSKLCARFPDYSEELLRSMLVSPHKHTYIITALKIETLANSHIPSSSSFQRHSRFLLCCLYLRVAHAGGSRWGFA